MNRILLRIYLLQQIIVPTVLHNINQPSISTISRIFTTKSVSRHGKGEVDHVWGLAICFAHQYVGTGGKVLNITDCKDFLGTKFVEKPNPKFFLKLIDVDVANSRAEARLKKYLATEVSDSFQVMVFQPNFTTFKAAFHLCICDN